MLRVYGRVAETPGEGQMGAGLWGDGGLSGATQPLYRPSQKSLSILKSNEN